MAIPIRLTLANGKDEIDLVAQSLDMSINRNVSAFPTPNNLLQRFAVDTNIPSIKIDINGIFVDDEGLSVDSGSTVTFDAEPMRTAINFGALLPTDRNNLIGRRGGILHPNNRQTTSSWDIVEPNWISSENIPKGQQSTISLLGMIGSDFEEASDDTEELDVNPSILFKSTGSFSGVSQITVNQSNTTFTYTADSVLNVGDQLTKSDGTIIGIISSVSTNTINFTTNIATSLATNDEIHISLRVFNHIGEELGFASYLIDDSAVDDGDTAKYTLGLTAVNAAEVKHGFSITINRVPEILERFRDQCIKVIPSYWLENPPIAGILRDTSMERANGPYGPSNTVTDFPRVGIRLNFDFNTAYTTAPSLTRTGLIVSSTSQFASFTDAANYDVVINVPIKSIDTADNPALAMAEQVKKALDGTVITSNLVGSTKTGFNPSNDRTLASAFTVTQNGVVVVIEQVYKPNIDILHPSCLSPDLTDIFTKDVEFHSRGSTPSESKKSAGDKVQDLIGLVSNANRNSDLLRGIQIPYDSLVTSTGVTGVARNFFTTFGEIDISQKGSEFNSASASIPMQNLLLGMSDGGAGGESPDKWYDSLLDLPVVSEIESIFGFLVGAGQQLWVTLTDKASGGNSGGIRIIPEKLHVRYDAGNNYYAFNLELMASDYVIGV